MAVDPEGSKTSAGAEHRWSVIDVAVVFALTFVLHRLMTRTLSGAVLWWWYYPALLSMATGYLLARRRPLPAGASPRLLTWRAASLGVGAALGLVTGMWLLMSGLAYLALLAGEAPLAGGPWWLPMRTGGSIALPLSFLAVSVGPLVEEYIFRGVIYAGLLERFGAVPAALLSAAGFAAFHLHAVAFSFFTGLMLAAVYRRTGSLLAATLAHVTVNGALLAAGVLARHVGIV